MRKLCSSLAIFGLVSCLALAQSDPDLLIDVPADPSGPSWLTAPVSVSSANVTVADAVRFRIDAAAGEWVLLYTQVYVDIAALIGDDWMRGWEIIHVHPWLAPPGWTGADLVSAGVDRSVDTASVSLLNSQVPVGIHPNRIVEDLDRIVGPEDEWDPDRVKALAQGVYADSNGHVQWTAKSPSWTATRGRNGTTPSPSKVWERMESATVPSSFDLMAIVMHAMSEQFRESRGFVPDPQIIESLFFAIDDLALTMHVQAVVLSSDIGRPIQNAVDWASSRGLDSLRPPGPTPPPPSLPRMRLTEVATVAMQHGAQGNGPYAIIVDVDAEGQPVWGYPSVVGTPLKLEVPVPIVDGTLAFFPAEGLFILSPVLPTVDPFVAEVFVPDGAQTGLVEIYEPGSVMPVPVHNGYQTGFLFLSVPQPPSIPQ